ncbi:MAG: glutathione synthase [Candidatus Melainabacteria bacterium]|nr:glutathione synthase [Candidatus Melainabacteria bacterium]
MPVSDVKRFKKVKRKFYKNKLKVAFIADDIKTLNSFGIHHNATFGLMLASQELLNKKNTRGVLLLASSNDLKIKQGKVYGMFDEVFVHRGSRNYLKVLSRKEYLLDTLDVIFLRKDPPFDQSYLILSYILSLASCKTLILNDPHGVLRANEKLYACNFPELMPPTLVSSDKKEILQFLQKYKDIVIKPLFYKGGIGVEHLKLKDENVSKLITDAIKKYSILMAQKYLSVVKQGDKRILLLDGKILGAILRIPKKGEFRAHISRGAKYKKLKLSKRDLYVCNKLKPYLKRDGLFLTGVDLIGKYLIEINVTCPANIVEASECYKQDFAKKIILEALRKVNH